MIIELLIGFFNDYLQLDEQRNDNRKYIMCLDNCEDMIEKNQKKFQVILNKLIEECPNLTIVITSNKDLNEARMVCMPAICVVHSLSIEKMVKMFVDAVEE